MTTPIAAPHLRVTKTTSSSITVVVSQDPPNLLHHYTSGRGLRGIIEGKQLWASHVYYLNDYSEYVATFDQLKGLLDRMPTVREALNSRPHLRDALLALHPYHRGRPPSIFVTCFSEDGDDLSQWRGYTKPGDGYAVAFDPVRLAARAESLGFRLQKVEYGERGIHASDYHLMPMLQNLVDTYVADTPDQAAAVVASMKIELQKLATYMKHWGFHGEREWRLISPLYDDSVEKFQFRDGSSFLVPYVHFDLPDLTTEDVPSIIVGPGPNMDLAMTSARTFMRQRGVNATGSVASAPYRPW